jgi:hypothetical protein
MNLKHNILALVGKQKEKKKSGGQNFSYNNNFFKGME